VNDIGEAGALSLKSGVDLELPDGIAFYALKEKIEAGEYDVKYVDQAVRRVLEMKLRGNIFETPYSDGAEADALTGNQEARDLALEAAKKAAVLLKNENNILGVTLTDNRSWWDDEVNLIDRDQNMSDIYKAVAIAKDADLIILAIGGDESTSREAWSEIHGGDRDDITLIGQQKELVDALAETGKPMVSVIISGRPIALTNVEDKLDAILYGWILGQETGTAVADLLMGDANPSGKMPVSVPRSVGQIPAFYNHKPTARRGYAFVEVVQMYLRDKVSSVTRPVKELKGFKRVSLEPGASETVTLPITTEALQFFNRDMVRVVEPGEFDIMVGNSSANVKTVTLTVE